MPKYDLALDIRNSSFGIILSAEETKTDYEILLLKPNGETPVVNTPKDYVIPINPEFVKVIPKIIEFYVGIQSSKKETDQAYSWIISFRDYLQKEEIEKEITALTLQAKKDQSMGYPSSAIMKRNNIERLEERLMKVRGIEGMIKKHSAPKLFN